jgi:hypothetical protein
LNPIAQLRAISSSPLVQQKSLDVPVPAPAPLDSETESEGEESPRVEVPVSAKEDTAAPPLVDIMEQGEDMGFDEGSGLYERIGRIWDSLGFSARDKLEMTIKYSDGAAASQRFVVAAKLWETAGMAVHLYEKAYKSLKDCLNVREQPSVVKLCEESFETAEEGIRAIAQRLRTQCDDWLVIKQRSAADLLHSRREKIQALKQEWEGRSS